MKQEKNWFDICKCEASCEHECGCDWMEYVYNKNIPKMNSAEKYDKWKEENLTKHNNDFIQECSKVLRELQKRNILSDGECSRIIQDVKHSKTKS